MSHVGGALRQKWNLPAGAAESVFKDGLLPEDSQFETQCDLREKSQFKCEKISPQWRPWQTNI